MEDSLKARITDVKVNVDMKFLGELTESATKVKKSTYFAPNKFLKNEFIIKHYAGDVSYAVDGFVEKSRDTLQVRLCLCFVLLLCGEFSPPLFGCR